MCSLTLHNLIFKIWFFFYKTFLVNQAFISNKSQPAQQGSIFIWISFYILMKPLSTFIINIPHILWENGQMRMKDMYLQRHVASKILVAIDQVLHHAFSLTLFCFPRNPLHRSLNISSISLIVASKFLLFKSWRIWGPTDMPFLILTSLVLWKITLRY